MESTLGELETKRSCQIRNVVEGEKLYCHEQKFRFNLPWCLQEEKKKKRNIKSKHLFCKDNVI